MPTVTMRFSRAAPPTWRERWQTKTLIDYSLWICRLTHSPFSHVDLVLDDGNLLGSSNSPQAPIVRGNAAGVAVRPPDYQRFYTRRDVVIPTTPQRKKRFEAFCEAQLGKPFDTAALMPRQWLSPNFHDRDWHANAAWWCAELMTCATEAAPLLDWPIPGIKNRVTCADLILILAPLYDFSVAMQPIPGLELERWEQ